MRKKRWNVKKNPHVNLIFIENRWEKGFFLRKRLLFKMFTDVYFNLVHFYNHEFHKRSSISLYSVHRSDGTQPHSPQFHIIVTVNFWDKWITSNRHQTYIKIIIILFHVWFTTINHFRIIIRECVLYMLYSNVQCDISAKQILNETLL